MKNFGFIKTLFINLMSEGIVENDATKKRLYVEFVNAVKKNKLLKKQFQVYQLLENANDMGDMTKDYIKECVSLISPSEKEALVLENSKLLIPLMNLNIETLDSDYPEKTLHESISELIFTNKSAKTINSIMEHTNKVNSFIKDKVPVLTESKGAGVPNSLLLKAFKNKFEEEYGDVMSEADIKVVNSFISENEESRIEVFGGLVSECLELVNEKLKENDADLKETLLEVKEKLLDTKYSKDTYKEEVSKLMELRNDLSE